MLQMFAYTYTCYKYKNVLIFDSSDTLKILELIECMMVRKP